MTDWANDRVRGRRVLYQGQTAVKISHRLRGLLALGPSTIPELAADAACEGISLRNCNIAMWVLTSSGQAEKCGHVPGEGKSKGNNLYRLTRKGYARERQSKLLEAGPK